MPAMSPASPVGMSADDLKKLMVAYQIKSAAELAARLGVNRSTVTRWLNGQRRIDIGAAALIRQQLGKRK